MSRKRKPLTPRQLAFQKKVIDAARAAMAPYAPRPKIKWSEPLAGNTVVAAARARDRAALDLATSRRRRAANFKPAGVITGKRRPGR